MEIGKYSKWYYSNNKCVDCGKLIVNKATRCKSCNIKGERHSIIYTIHPNYGKKWDEERRNTIKAELNPAWKGENITLESRHQWIRNNKSKPKFCEICKIKPPFEVANISGEYKRDINDYKWVCRRCHMKEDGRLYKPKRKHENIK